MLKHLPILSMVVAVSQWRCCWRTGEVKKSRTYFLYKPSYSTFYLKVPKFSLPW